MAVVLTRPAGSVPTGTIPVSQGGTGITTTPTNGQLPIGNGSGYSLNTLTAGPGITITNGPGTITISSTGSGSGSVSSVDASGGTTGLTFTGGPITSSGVLTLSGTLGVPNGGTGLTSVGGVDQILGVNNSGSGLEYKTITPGAGITVTNTAGVITIASTASAGLQLYAENPIFPSPPSALGQNSIALLSQSEASAQDSLAIGPTSIARHRGGMVHSAGRFTTNGDAQIGRYILRNTTINQIPTRLFLDGNAATVNLVLPDNSTWSFRVMVTGHRFDAGDGHAGYELKGVIYRNSGVSTTTIQGAVSKIVLAESNAPWDTNVTADNVTGSLMINVTGQASKTIRWLALVETVEITN